MAYARIVFELVVPVTEMPDVGKGYEMLGAFYIDEPLETEEGKLDETVSLDKAVDWLEVTAVSEKYYNDHFNRVRNAQRILAALRPAVQSS